MTPVRIVFVLLGHQMGDIKNVHLAALEVFLGCGCGSSTASSATTSASSPRPCWCCRAWCRTHLEWIVVAAVDHGGLRFVSGYGNNDVPAFFGHLSKRALSALKRRIGGLARAVSDDNERKPHRLRPLCRHIKMIRGALGGFRGQGSTLLNVPFLVIPILMVCAVGV